MEVSRIKLRQLGVDFGDAMAGLRYGGTGDRRRTRPSWFNLKSLALGQAGSYSVSLPSAYIQILESDSDTKIIAQPRLRGVSDEKITYKVGQKVPIPQTTFQAYAAGGVNNVPVTNFQQQDVGIEINFTPRVHLEKDVTLDAEIKVTSIGGSGYADIPIINNREIKNVVRLRDGETQLIAGLIRDEERKVDQGHPRAQGHSRAGPPVRVGDDQHRADRRHRHHHPLCHPDRSPGRPSDAKPIWVDVDTAASAVPGGVFDDSLLDRGADPDAAQLALQRRRAAEGAANLISLTPANLEGAVGREFRMAVNVRSDQDLSALSLSVTFDPRVVVVKDAAEGSLGRTAAALRPPSSSTSTRAACAPSASRATRRARGLAAGRWPPCSSRPRGRGRRRS